MCKSKIHQAHITGTELRYEGSIGIDKTILEAANIFPNEMVHVLNLNTGARFETYAIEEQEGSGKVIFYGPAARLGEVGDQVIVISQAIAEAKEVQSIKTKVVYVDANNKIIKK